MAKSNVSAAIVIDDTTGTKTVFASKNMLGEYYFSVSGGGVALSTAVAINPDSGTPAEGNTVLFYHPGRVTLTTGGSVTIFGNKIGALLLQARGTFLMRYNGASWDPFFMTDQSGVVDVVKTRVIPIGGAAVSLDSGFDGKYQYFTGTGALASDIIITLTTTNSKQGHYFFLDLNFGFTSSGALIKVVGATTLTLNIQEVGRRVLVLCIYDGTSWNLVPVNKSIDTTDILPNAVTDAKIRKGAAKTIMGNKLSSLSDVADIAFNANDYVLGLDGETNQLSTSTFLGMRVMTMSISQAQARLLGSTKRNIIPNPSLSTDIIQIHSAMVQVTGTNASNSGISSVFGLQYGSASGPDQAMKSTKAFASTADRTLRLDSGDTASESQGVMAAGSGIWATASANPSTFVGDLLVTVFYSKYSIDF